VQCDIYFGARDIIAVLPSDSKATQMRRNRWHLVQREDTLVPLEIRWNGIQQMFLKILFLKIIILKKIILKYYIYIYIYIYMSIYIIFTDEHSYLSFMQDRVKVLT